MYITLTAMIVGILLSVISILARRERSSHKVSGVIYKMEKTLIYTCLVVSCLMITLAIFLSMQAIFYGGSHGADAGVPAFIGLLSALCALVWSIYEVRLDANSIRFGLAARQSLLYLEIKEIEDIRSQGSPRAILVRADGKKFNIWSNLLGYVDLVDKLKVRCTVASYHLIEGRVSRR
jgi:hypothetical protein